MLNIDCLARMKSITRRPFYEFLGRCILKTRKKKGVRKSLFPGSVHCADLLTSFVTTGSSQDLMSRIASILNLCNYHQYKHEMGENIFKKINAEVPSKP